MYIISGKNMLRKAQPEGYTVSAFDIHNPKTLQVVVESATQLRSPVMLAGILGTYRYGGVGSLISLVQSLAREYNLPLILYPDHHEEGDGIFNKVRAGVRPVVINSSHLPLEDNIAWVQEVTTFCHRSDVSVEAGLGCLGNQKDDLRADEKDSAYTSPAAAVKPTQRTQIDPLVIAIGTAYGLCAYKLRLSFVRLEQTRQRVEIPLVLHDASGLLEQDAQYCIRRDICRVSVATELKIVPADVLKGYFYNSPTADDPRRYMQPARAVMKEIVTRIIGVCGSEGEV